MIPFWSGSPPNTVYRISNMGTTFQPFNTVLHEQEVLLSKRVEEIGRLLDEINTIQVTVEHSLQSLYLAEDENGWKKIAGDGKSDDYDRKVLGEIIQFAKLMFINNPMINRAVKVQQLYVWALGYTVSSTNPELKSFVERFLKTRKNRAEFSYEGMKTKEAALQYSGNLFLCFFINETTGDVSVRTIDVNVIEAVYTNPDDPREPWFYLRKIRDPRGGTDDKYIWHPDWEFEPVNRGSVEPPQDQYTNFSRSPIPVDWQHPIFHIKTGGTDNMRFGFPEIFSALNWAKALRRFYENWSTMMEAYAKVAMQMVKNDKSSLAASRSKVQNAVGSNGTQRLIGDSGANPVGQYLLQSGGMRLEAVKTAGATTGTEEGRGLAKMVAAGVGLGLNLLGDLDHGNEATANTMDRPTELRMVDRQGQWNEWMTRIILYAMMWSARAPQGVLRKSGYKAERNTNIVDKIYEWDLQPPGTSTMDVSIEFPDILERNATERVRALIMTITMMGKPVSKLFPDKRYVARKALEAIGESSDVIEQLLIEWDKLGAFSDNMNMDDLNPEPEPVMGPGNGVPAPAGGGE